MLTLTVGLRAGADGPWQWCEQAEGCWRRGRDRIRPLAHPALEARAVTGGITTLMVVRERAAGRASLLRSTAPVRVDGAVYARAVEECRDWPLQSVWVEAGPDGVRLSTGLGGVCPLYLAHGQGTLSGSWQLMDLSAQMTPGQLDEKEVMRLLTGRPRYGHDTLVTGIKRLSERSSAYADADGLRLAYPAAAEHAAPSELAEGTDGPTLVGAFEALVDHIGAHRPLTPAQTAAQLSGARTPPTSRSPSRWRTRAGSHRARC